MSQDHDAPDQTSLPANGDTINAQGSQGFVNRPSGPVTINYQLPAPSLLTPQQRLNRARMLDKVQLSWIEGVLEQSLYQIARVDLGIAYTPEQVEHPWEAIVQRPSQADHAVEANTPIIKIFDDLKGELLILGAPGAGKTTLLLELARDLIDRARDNEQHPIPIVFNLSTWASKQLPLNQWLTDELNQRYDVPRTVAQEWVQSNSILSLLDGLDEVAAEHRAGCVEAINTYRQVQAGLLPLAVCSRVADYEALAVRLRLAGAVVVQPLTANQIEAYLERVGPSLDAVHRALRADQTLWELLDNPLMLSIVALAYKNKSAVKLQAAETLDARRHQLFDDYLEAMFGRRSKETRYPRAKTVWWLSWLARQVQHQGQTVFLIEHMQPSLLRPRFRRLYALAIRLIVGVCTGLVFGALAGWFFGPGYGLVYGLATMVAVAVAWELTGRPTIDVAGGLALAPAEAVVCGLARGLMTENWLSALAAGVPTAAIIGLAAGLVRVSSIDVAETWSWSRAQAWRRGLSGGLVVGLVSGLSFAFTLKEAPQAAAIRGLLWGISTGLITGIALGLSRGQLQVRAAPNEGIRRSLRNAVYWSSTLTLGVVLTVAPSSYLGFGLAYGWPAGYERAIFDSINYGLSILLVTVIVFGGFACIQHVVLRLLLCRAGAIPWNYVRFLDYCTERIFLRRVGGGYIFAHRLLMEYFASLHNDAQDA